MASGQDQVERETYHKLITEKQDRELLIEVAMGLYDVKVNCSQICFSQPSTGKQRAFNYTGLAGFFVAVAIGIYEYITKKPN
jgi:hypothetical protein